MQETTSALKEWQVAVNALEQGETILLLRKGGIRETEGKFSVQHEEVLLYPTYEHQQPELLKPDYAAQVQPVESGWHPNQVRIGSWAKITDIIQITEADAIARLLPLHIWNVQWVIERLKWKPNQPIHGLLLRTYLLPEPQIIPYTKSYGGCKSWIELQTAISLSDHHPVLSEAEYEQQVKAIRAEGEITEEKQYC
ncbi:DUF1802 family protein [Phormidium sp. CLA17]|uniref:DUF1802 family protein n=1 Tax=Leptolyngbya sp. Cla-17 TaxID=2803751 RepID=UPI0014909821|nr:DUF1802 family protein [Leptolyngbya sp. Cla-17]MBM0740085.1 DUF1802 family protein [Leptolyngbya sp. Cla-17]